MTYYRIKIGDSEYDMEGVIPRIGETVWIEGNGYKVVLVHHNVALNRGGIGTQAKTPVVLLEKL